MHTAFYKSLEARFDKRLSNPWTEQIDYLQNEHYKMMMMSLIMNYRRQVL